MKTDKTPADLSPVFTRAQSARPQVQAPDSPATVWIGVVGAGLLGFAVFNGLSAGHPAKAQTPAPKTQAAAVTTPVAAPITAPVSPATTAPQTMPAPTMTSPPPPDPSEAHWRAPTMVVDFSGAPEGAAAAVQVAQAGAAPAGAQPPAASQDRGSADERFAARITGGNADVARATQMRDLGRTIPQGTVVAAVLETAINSDLPGSVRAVVSRDIRSFDGSRVLVPRGSKLIGQYKSAVAAGQTRAFVVWSRIITPAGVTVDVGSPATDRLGRGGLAGDVNTHFFRRFGSSILLSVVSAGAQAAANKAVGNNGGTTLVIGSTAQATQVADAVLQQQISIPDTITVPQGVPVEVFVARDLDFGAVAP